MTSLRMNDTNFTNIKQVQVFLESSNYLNLIINYKRERLAWIQKVLLKFRYKTLSKKDKSIIRKYINKFTGYSKSQMDRLIEKHFQGTLLKKSYNRNFFTRTYSDKDILLLAHTDEVHKRPCGKTVKTIMNREYSVHKKEEYKNIHNVSIAHIYNLRKTFVYKNNTSFFSKTIPAKVNIGTRTKPKPSGKPGYLRVDTVHQGDLNGAKGVYHINVVDIVTQWEVVACVPAITWEYMLDAFKDIIDQYSFVVWAFHADNGSEYINQEVSKMLNNLNIQLTKSRARQSNDNALIESKNGSVVRKHMTHIHIPKINYYKINEFYKNCFNTYLNYHRPCLFATTITDKKGKQIKKYPDCRTPYDMLKSLDNPEQYLKKNISFDDLNKIAYDKSDNEFAETMMKEKQLLFKNFIFPF